MMKSFEIHLRIISYVHNNSKKPAEELKMDKGNVYFLLSSSIRILHTDDYKIISEARKIYEYKNGKIATKG